MKLKNYFDKILFFKFKELNFIQLQEKCKTFVSAESVKKIIKSFQNIHSQGQQNIN
jgi:hypothetical protein